jgi:hypothetical protein
MQEMRSRGSAFYGTSLEKSMCGFRRSWAWKLWLLASGIHGQMCSVPYCSDVLASCSLRLSRFLCSNARWYPELDQDQMMDAVERIYEEGDFLKFDELRLSLTLKLPAHPDDDGLE